MNGQTDGSKYIDKIDPDDPEYVRQMQRPADVKEDMRHMEERSRVSRIMKSQAFREELEEMVSDQMSCGPHPASLLALKQITELIMPQSRPSAGKTMLGGTAGSVIPIADLRGVDSLNYSKGEKVMRNKTATLYRLIDLQGGSYGFNGLITTRLSQDYEHFLVIPHGLLYGEVTASNLLKVDMQGDVLDPGSTTLRLNKAAFSLHGAIHAARPDLKALVHIRTPGAVSVSVQNCGLLSLCPEAMTLGDISYYTYCGVLTEQEDKDKLTRALGPNNTVLFLRSYGVLIGGSTIDEAFLVAQNVITAIDTQLRTIHVGLDNIALPSEEVCKRAQDLANQSGGDNKKKWRRGELEFEAFNRQLDNAGYRTGHVYRESISRRQDKREKSNSEVEVPPAASSSGSYYEDNTRSPLKHHLDMHKKVFRTEWLNSPNAYKKEEIEEIGTRDPKKITKWVKEGDGLSPTVKVEQPNLFAPQGENPKELKQKYKAIRKEYYEDHIDAGPQSRILEGATYDEARKLQEGNGDTMIVMGAASKGIIQRDHQHNAVVYKTQYAKNPFDNMSEDEMDKYKAEVEQKSGSVDQPGSADEAYIPVPEVSQVTETTTVTTTVVTSEPEVLSSPAKSTSSNEARVEVVTSDVTSASESTAEKGSEKKKKKSRMPSFKKEKKEKKEKKK